VAAQLALFELVPRRECTSAPWNDPQAGNLRSPRKLSGEEPEEDDVNQDSSTVAGLARPPPVDTFTIAASIASSWDTSGFGPLTRIETDYGPVPAHTLEVTDLVRLRTGRFGPIARVDRLLLDDAFLDRNQDAQPVLIQPGRLGYGLPVEPVLLAPGQKLSDRQKLPASLGTAHDLLLAGIAQRRPERSLTYIVLSFEEPEDVCSGGLWLRVEPIALGQDSLDPKEG
jgi:hypothetical protein